MAKDPSKVASKWAQNVGNATQAYIDGINSVTENPMAKAAAALPKYLAKVQEAVNSGKMARRLQAVPQSTWQQNAVTFGAQKLPQAATQAKSKMEQFMSQFLPYVETVRNKVRAMPSTTPQDRINRMIANAQGLAQFKRS